MRFFRAWGQREESRDEASAHSPEASESTRAADASQEDTLSGDRGIPSVNRVRSVQSRVSSLLAVMLMSVLGVGMLGWYYGRALNQSAQSHERAQASARAHVQGEMPLPPLGQLEPPPFAQSLEPQQTVTVTA